MADNRVFPLMSSRSNFPYQVSSLRVLREVLRDDDDDDDDDDNDDDDNDDDENDDDDDDDDDDDNDDNGVDDGGRAYVLRVN